MGPSVVIAATSAVVVVCLVLWFGFHLVAQNGRLLVRIEALERRLAGQGSHKDMPLSGSLGLPSGSVLNDFALPLLEGGTMTLSQWRGRKVVLIFLSPRCPHSEKLLPELASLLAGNVENDPKPVVISTGSVEENRKFFGEHQITCPIVLQEDAEVAGLYLALATPMAYLVNEHGATLGPAAVGPAPIIELLRDHTRSGDDASGSQLHTVSTGSLAGSRINRDGLKAGTKAPEFSLPALNGKEISLNSYRGKPVLLVFSDPNCRPCNELLPKLEEVHRKSQDLEVLVIGRGEIEANREKVKKLGITFPIVLQKTWEISRAYGMFATPIGYLVDEEGVIAEDVAVGGNRILSLAAQRRDTVLRAG